MHGITGILSVPVCTAVHKANAGMFKFDNSLKNYKIETADIKIFNI